jgi:choline dehydrogenase-like flavoprotein
MRAARLDPTPATIRALVRSCCPDATGRPDQVEAACVLAGRLIAGLSGPARAGLVTAALTLETSTVLPRFGWRRFSGLDPASGLDAVRWLRDSRPRTWRLVGLLRDLAVVAWYEQPEVRRQVGYDPDDFAARRGRERELRWHTEIDEHRRLLLAPSHEAHGPAPTEPAPPHQAHRDAWHDLECDVVVVGSGAGGGVAAAELAEAGLAVVVLEEGGYHPTSSFTSSTAEMLLRLYRESAAAATVGRSPVAYAEGRCVGGSTTVNGAMAFRAPDRIIDGWAADLGQPHLADELGHGYARVERLLHVSTQDPGSIGRDQELLRSGASALGWRVVDDTRAQVHCAGCNLCTWGCPTGAKQSTLVSYLPRASSFGAEVWSDCRVDRILFDGDRAAGVEGRTTVPVGATDALPSRPFRVRSRHVVVAGGAMQTPALLQRSGVRSAPLGRHLALHPGIAVAAMFDEPVVGWKGTHQAYQVREFENDGIVMAAVNLPPSLVARAMPFEGPDLARMMAAYDRVVTAGVLVEDTSRGRVRAVGREGVLATYQLGRRDVDTIARATLLLTRALLAAGATSVHVPLGPGQEVRSPADVARLSSSRWRPGDLVTNTVHLMGTARLGRDPATSVCDPWGAVHDRAGLSVADASLFPTPIGVNPMLTVQALSTRVATRVAEGLR